MFLLIQSTILFQIFMVNIINVHLEKLFLLRVIKSNNPHLAGGEKQLLLYNKNAHINVEMVDLLGKITSPHRSTAPTAPPLLWPMVGYGAGDELKDESQSPVLKIGQKLMCF